MNRTIAIGDIHGCSDAFRSLIEVIGPDAADTLILLGDYVNRGADSKGVIDLLIELEGRCRLVPILGNHDQMMLNSRNSEADFQAWLDFGGATTLTSYGNIGCLDAIPESHFDFLQRCRSYYESRTHIFLHANYLPELPITDQSDATIRWLSLRDYIPPHRHCSHKTVIVGHTPQRTVLDLDYLICLDTGCCKGGWLTAMDVETKEVWMADANGQLRL